MIALRLLSILLAATCFSGCAQSSSPKSNQQNMSDGVVNGGGGKGVMCDDQVFVLDLYEAREIFHLPITQKYSDFDKYLAIYGTNMVAHILDMEFDTSNASYQQVVLDSYKKHLLPLFQDIPSGSQLSFTPDATLPQIPSNCSFVQIATFTTDSRIYRDRKLWDKLSPMDQAFLVIHESLYSSAKTRGAVTSDFTRRVIGLLAAEQLPEPILKPVWGRKRVECGIYRQGEHQPYEMYAVDEMREGQSGVGIYFAYFNNIYLVERVSTFVPNLSTEDFFRENSPLISTSVEGDLSGIKWNLELQLEQKSSSGIKIRAWSANEKTPSFSWFECNWWE